MYCCHPIDSTDDSTWCLIAKGPWWLTIKCDTTIAMSWVSWVFADEPNTKRIYRNEIMWIYGLTSGVHPVWLRRFQLVYTLRSHQHPSTNPLSYRENGWKWWLNHVESRCPRPSRDPLCSAARGQTRTSSARTNASKRVTSSGAASFRSLFCCLFLSLWSG